MTKLPERVMLNHRSFIFDKNHFLFRAFNRKLLQLVEAGLADKFIADYENDFKLDREPDGEPAVLLFLFISLLCFCLELLRDFNQKKIEKCFINLAAKNGFRIAVQVYLDAFSHH